LITAAAITVSTCGVLYYNSQASSSSPTPPGAGGGSAKKKNGKKGKKSTPGSTGSIEEEQQKDETKPANEKKDDDGEFHSLPLDECASIRDHIGVWLRYLMEEERRDKGNSVLRHGNLSQNSTVQRRSEKKGHITKVDPPPKRNETERQCRLHRSIKPFFDRHFPHVDFSPIESRLDFESAR